MRAILERSWRFAAAGACGVVVIAAASVVGAAPDAKTVRLWQAKCAPCHGDDGKAATTKGKEMGIRSATTAEWQKTFSDNELRAAIHDGLNRSTADGKKQEMDGYGAKLSAEQIDALVGFMRSLGPSPAPGAAAPTPAAPPASQPATSATAASAASAAPPAPTKATLARGKTVFKARCASCHGAAGNGQTTKGKRLGVADMTAAAWQTGHSDAEIAAALQPKAKVKSGGTEIAHLTVKLGAKDIAALSGWLRTLAPR